MATRSSRTPFVNRFAAGGVARVGADFTDRADERARIATALATPGGHLLLAGPRRMGKTSLLLAVRDDLARKRPPRPVLYVDLWAASSIEDVVTRLLRDATRVLGRSWHELLEAFATRLKVSFHFADAGGILVPLPALELRGSEPSVLDPRFGNALDILEETAARRRVHLGVMLDEFQELRRLGGEGAVKRLRATIQHHRHVSYVLAGSDRRLITELTAARDGPLHNLARRIELGPISADHFARWIDDTFTAMGLRGARMGSAILAAAGPRTRDVRALAEAVADRAYEQQATLAPSLVGDGMELIVRQRRPQYEQEWKTFTPLQQNVLRAAAAVGRGLTRENTRARFSLGDTSRVAKTIEALAQQDVLVKLGREHGAAIAFDDPFFRAWVIRATLVDVGLSLPVTHDPLAEESRQTQRKRS